MVRENRVKDYTFPSFAVTGSNVGPTYSDNPINGEVLKVRVESVASPGSLWIAESGANIVFYKKNNFTSGLATDDYYPIVYGADNTGTTGSPQAYLNRVVNNVVWLAGSGFTSGAAVVFGPVTVFYR